MKKLLLFGGAFNPPHKGHSRLLASACETISPDVILVMPSATSPHKKNAEVNFFHRANMSQTFKDISPKVKISLMEERGRKRRNYTYWTIKRIKKKYFNHKIILLIGSDMLDSFKTWNRYERVLNLADIAVASRYEEGAVNLKKSIDEICSKGGRIIELKYKPLEISSSKLREMLYAGEDVFRFIDKFVADYIRKHKLYGGV
jgi:nicotinate-nucleotide adenylyltransferase